jgi:hypothetical protein
MITTHAIGPVHAQSWYGTCNEYGVDLRSGFVAVQRSGRRVRQQIGVRMGEQVAGQVVMMNSVVRGDNEVAAGGVATARIEGAMRERDDRHEDVGTTAQSADPQSVLIRDAEGGELTTATIRLDGGARLIVLSDVRDPAALMTYFFGQGSNHVSLSLTGGSAEGRLDTRWQGVGRTWMVKLKAPLTLRPDAPVEQLEARAQPRSVALGR